MKNSLSDSLLLFIIILIFASCYSNQTNNRYQSKEQNRFNQFILQSNKEYAELGNDIQKEEYFKDYLFELSRLSDSIGVLKNWKGHITKIKVEEPNIFNGLKDDYRLLNIEIKIKLNYQDFTFYCKKLYKLDEADSLLLYSQAKNISVNSEIYFDGFISKNSENQVNFMTSISSREIDPYYRGKLFSPEIKFHIISLSPNQLKYNNDSIVNLLMDKSSLIWKSMSDFSKGIISRKKLNSIMTDNKSEIEFLMTQLSYEEKSYIKSYTNCLNLEFQDYNKLFD